MENYTEKVKDFMESLSDGQREVMDIISDGIYEAGYTEGVEDYTEQMQGKLEKRQEDRTTFGEPQPEDIKELISMFPEMLESYDEGVKEALKYAGMVNVLAKVGLSMETLESLIANDMVLKRQGQLQEGGDLESIIEEESRKY